MGADVDIHGPTKQVLLLASNPATSSQTGWPVGFWWAELTHPYWEFVEAGYEVTIASPDGGALEADSFDAAFLVGGQAPMFTFREDKRVKGFANSEEQYADDFVGERIQPFWIEDEARVLKGTNFIAQGRFRPHAVRDGNLAAGQQQYSGVAAARLVIEALGR